MAKKSADKHSTERPISANFVNLSPISCSFSDEIDFYF